MYYLKLRYELLPHPYKEEKSSSNELWASIQLYVVDNMGSIVQEIYLLQWDIKVLIQWFIDNREWLLQEKLPIEPYESSIAETIYEFYENVDPDDANILDSIYNYRTRHDLWFALRGTDVQDVYIGLGNNGYEVSCCSESEKWAYNIKLSTFLQNIDAFTTELLA
jgi:hypothetical protein